MDARPACLAWCPYWLTRWLGYHATPPQCPVYVDRFWSFIGAFSGLIVLQAFFLYIPYFVDRGVPSMIASLGSSAVLCFGVIEAQVSQPRSLIVGHFMSALLGLCITKLFSLSPHFESVRWVAAALSTSVAISAMQFTDMMHPPAGATALLPALDEAVWALGWDYLPVILLSSTIIVVTALLANNIQRRYPTFWFTPNDDKCAEKFRLADGSV